MVFQSYALYPHMSVFDNMSFALRLANVDKAEIKEKVKRAAEILNLTQYLERTPKDLSGGQRQRVAIGRAIVRAPKVFLFDEPLSNLDAALRGQTRIEIAELHRDLGATTIYVTHDQVEAMTLADRVVVLRDGVIEQVGSPLELYDQPANQFVAQFIGTPQMNVVDTAALPALAAIVGAADGTDGFIGVRPENVIVKPAGDGRLAGQGRTGRVARRRHPDLHPCRRQGQGRADRGAPEHADQLRPGDNVGAGHRAGFVPPVRSQGPARWPPARLMNSLTGSHRPADHDPAHRPGLVPPRPPGGLSAPAAPDRRPRAGRSSAATCATTWPETMAALIEQRGEYTLETVSPAGERHYERISSIREVIAFDPTLARLIEVGADDGDPHHLVHRHRGRLLPRQPASARPGPRGPEGRPGRWRRHARSMAR